MELLIAGAGAAIGGATLGTGVVALGLTGAQIGWMAGSMIGSMLFAPKGPNTEGPRVQDKSVQVSTYGNMISRLYGTSRIAGNVIFATPLVEEAVVTEYGKGGGGGSVTTYNYYGFFATSICEGPISGVRKIWADGVLIFSMAEENEEAQYDSEVFVGFNTGSAGGATGPGIQSGVAPSGLVIYLGTEDQLPDPTIELTHGSATPAFRGQAYAVFSGIALKKFGNRIPNLTFEVVESGDEVLNAATLIIPVEDGTEGMHTTYRSPSTGFVWGLGYENNVLTIMDPIKKKVVSQTTLEQATEFGGWLQLIVPVPGLQQVWVTTASVFYNYWHKLTENGQFIETVRTQDWYTGSGDGYPVGSIGSGASCIVHFTNDWSLGAEFYVFMGYTETYTKLGGGSLDYYPPAYYFADEKFCGQWGDNTSSQNRIPTLGVMTNGEYFTDTISPSTRVELPYTSGFSANNATARFIAYDSKRDRFIIVGSDSIDSPAGDYAVFMHVDNLSVVQSYIATDGPGDLSSPSGIAYSESGDVFVVAYTGNTRYEIFNASTFAWIRSVAFTDGSFTLSTIIDFPEYGDRMLSWSGYPPTTNPPSDRSGLWVLPLGNKLSSLPVPLADIIQAESEIVGLSASDLDLTQITATVDGFTITKPSSARGVIEQLMVAYQFDAVESSGKIKYVPRGGSSVAALTINDLSAHRVGEEVPVPLPLARSDENELPTSVTLRYMVAEADYQVGAQESRRQTGNAFTNLLYDIPVVMQDETAKAVADAALYSTWAARNTVEFSTTFYYADLEPTDIITIDGNVVRIINKSVDANILRFKAAFEQGEVYLQGGIAGTTPPSDQISIDPAGRAYAVLLDTVLLRDQDDTTTYAFYTGATSMSGRWREAALYTITGAGVSPVIGYKNQAVIGYSVEPLDAYTDNLVDQYNTLKVYVIAGELYSTTYDQAMLDETLNVCVVGSEVIQFITANEISDGLYELSGLLRGRRGSEIVEHSAGENFMLLSTNTIYRSPSDLSFRNVETDYLLIAGNGTVETGQQIQFTNTCKGYDSLSPVFYGGHRDGSDNVTVRWLYRARTNQNLQNLYGTPFDFGRPFRFTVEWSDSPTGDFVTETVTLTYNGTETICEYTVTAASQTAEFGGAVNPMYFRIRVNSDLGDSQFYTEGNL